MITWFQEDKSVRKRSNRVQQVYSTVRSERNRLSRADCSKWGLSPFCGSDELRSFSQFSTTIERNFRILNIRPKCLKLTAKPVEQY